MVTILACYPMALMHMPLPKRLADISRLKEQRECQQQTLLDGCFFVLERDHLLMPTITLRYKGNSVVDMVRKLMIVDLEVELEYLISFLHLGE